MKLFYASGSPYARIARVAVRELGLSGTIEEVKVTLRDPASALLAHNPGRKVPALQLDDGTVINESLLVLSYLDTRHRGRKLLPMDGSDGWRTLSELGRAYAFLDAVTVWNRELRFGQSLPAIIALEKERANRAADALEAEIAGGGYSGAAQREPKSCSPRRWRISRGDTRCGTGAPAGRAFWPFSMRSLRARPSPRRCSPN